MARLKQIGIDVDVNGVIEGHRQSFSESENDILRRILLPPEPERTARQAPVQVPERPAGATRARGMWSVEISGARIAAANLKDAYRTLLVALSEEHPDFLELFSREKARSRRFVARTPPQLYLSSPRLAKDHAKPLADGWYFDTNLSAEQVSQRARIAARICGLRYGQDVKILNNFEEI